MKTRIKGMHLDLSAPQAKNEAATKFSELKIGTRALVRLMRGAQVIAEMDSTLANTKDLCQQAYGAGGNLFFYNYQVTDCNLSNGILCVDVDIDKK